jgi:hypothetical protein
MKRGERGRGRKASPQQSLSPPDADLNEAAGAAADRAFVVV